MLDWLCHRYPELRDEKEEFFTELQDYQSQQPKAATIAQVRGVEGVVAKDYWAIASPIIEKKFEGRVFGKTGRVVDHKGGGQVPGEDVNELVGQHNAADDA